MSMRTFGNLVKYCLTRKMKMDNLCMWQRRNLTAQERSSVPLAALWFCIIRPCAPWLRVRNPLINMGIYSAFFQRGKSNCWELSMIRQAIWWIFLIINLNIIIVVMVIIIIIKIKILALIIIIIIIIIAINLLGVLKNLA